MVMQSQLLAVILGIYFLALVSAQCSSNHGFNRTLKVCQDLPEQGATLAWSLYENNNTLEVIFSGEAPSADGWIGWGVNPGAQAKMIGASVFIAFRASNGSNLLPYKLSSYSIPACSPVDLEVMHQAVEISGTSMKMYLLLKLKQNVTTINHIWNRGPSVSNFQPSSHALSEIKSLGVLDLVKGSVIITAAPHQTLKNRHGIINAVGWGVLIPIGMMSARYLRPFESADPAWFYIHAACQSSGYILGVVGWATGLKLASYSSAVYYKHKNLGIAIFVFATLQVLSLLLRPKKDHEIRKYWNVYHHSIGYATLVMIIINVFEGLHILEPPRKYRDAYIGGIASLGLISLILEVVTWMVYLERRRKNEKRPLPPPGTTSRV